MDSDYGGNSPYQDPRKAAADAARKKVLAVYSSAMQSLKKTSERDNNLITPPSPETTYQEPSQQAYEQQAYEQSSYVDQPRPTPIQSQADYTTSDPTSSLKDAPINQSNINAEWQQYHSSWQNYYQKYYSEYYAKAAQSYLETEKLKSERIANGTVQRKRRIKHLAPIFIVASLILVFLFLQYNRLIFAPIMAYVSPDVGSVSSSIEAVDPSVTQTVSADPRLIIPKLNIDVPVAFGINYNDVMEAMNHGVAQFMIPGANAMPGQIGNLVISGHSAGDIYSSNPYKFIFSGLERLNVGDLIYVNYESTRYTYQMTGSQVVEPSDVQSLIYSTDKPILTLITCTPLGTSRYRLLIIAEQISPEYNTDMPDPGDTDNNDSDTNISMPANSPSFFENIWSGLFGN